MIYIFSFLLAISGTSIDNNPEELGKVNWIRDYNEALELSIERDKPVFILFQEVPGCSTCKNYGANVLSHPFIVEVIEDNFIPLVIYNNKKGKDKEVLDLYKEPTWNNPVVRIVDGKGKNIVERLSGNYNLYGLSTTISNALLASNKLVPGFLHLFEEELQMNNGKLKESYVSMYCFWTGEKVIGDIKGVVDTEAGFMDGKEVVKFKYNPEIVDYEDVLATAKKQKCADQAYTDDKNEIQIAENIASISAKGTKTYRSDGEPKYYLSQTNYKYLPMTRLQALRINSALGKRQDATEYLSPRQLELLEILDKDKTLRKEERFQAKFEEAWWKLPKSKGIRS